MQTPEILFIYQHLPHYRYGVFSAVQVGRGYECRFAADVASRDGSIPTIPVEEIARFHRLKNIWMGPFLWQRRLISVLLRGRRPKAVVFLGDSSYLSTWVAALLCRVLGIRVLFWTIGWHAPDRGVKKYYRLAFYRLAHELLLYGTVGLELGRKAGYPAARMRVIGNSYSSHLGSGEVASSERLSDLRSKLPGAGSTVLAAVVRLDRSRRFDLLIEAALILQNKGIDVELLLVGEGSALDTLKKSAEKNGVKLWAPGAVYSDTELSIVYERAALTVMPARSGLTTIQSLRYGTPVVTSDDIANQGPEVDAIKPGITGSLYRHGSAEDLAAHIQMWIIKLEDDSERIAEDCRREERDNWSPAVQAKRIVSACLADRELR